VAAAAAAASTRSCTQGRDARAAGPGAGAGGDLGGWARGLPGELGCRGAAGALGRGHALAEQATRREAGPHDAHGPTRRALARVGRGREKRGGRGERLGRPSWAREGVGLKSFSPFLFFFFLFSIYFSLTLCANK
jgi:hypothetical protein